MVEWLLGGTKTAEKVIDTGLAAVKGIGEYIDEQELTEEEKAVQRAKLLEAHIKFVESTHKENGTRSVTRRGIAWAVVLTILCSFALSVALLLLHPTADIDGIIELVKVFWLGEAFVAVIAFYFGAHLLKR